MKKTHSLFFRLDVVCTGEYVNAKDARNFFVPR